MKRARNEKAFLPLSTKEKHLCVQYFHMNERFSYGGKIKIIAQCNCVGQDIFWQSETVLSEGKQVRAKPMLLWLQDTWRVTTNYPCHCPRLRSFLYPLANKVSTMLLMPCDLSNVQLISGKNVHLTLFLNHTWPTELKINHREIKSAL